MTYLNLSPKPIYHEQINKIEREELATGGDNGNINQATKQLAENIKWLREAVKPTAKNFNTIDEMHASNLEDGSYAVVVNDAKENNGNYQKQKDRWVALSYKQGMDAVISDITVDTGDAGTAAKVVMGGTPSNRTFAFTIPKGEKGEKGDYEQITVSNINPTPFAVKSLMLKSDLPNFSYAIVLRDITPENNGIYQKINGEWQYLKWNQMNVGSTIPHIKKVDNVEHIDRISSVGKINGLNSLVVNKGDLYPFIYKNRGFDYTPEVTELEQSILAIKVNNADPNYYYRLRFFSHTPTEDNTGVNNGWVMTKIRKDLYGSENDEVDISSALNTKYKIENGSGINYFTLNATDGSEVSFDIVLDSDLLTDKTYILNNNTKASYHHIIDPYCYNYSIFKTHMFNDKVKLVLADLLRKEMNINEPAVAALAYGIVPINTSGEADFNNLLLYNNINVKSYPASITKVLTALVALESGISLDTKITIQESDLTIGSGYNLDIGDEITLLDALYNMMLPSSNTAATAVARHIGESKSGTIDTFVELMNSRAQSLGMHSSVFTNPTGLGDSEQVVCVADLLKLGYAASQNKQLRTIWSVSNHTINITGMNARALVVYTSFPEIKANFWCLGGKTGTFVGWGYNMLTHIKLQNGYTGILAILRNASYERRIQDTIAVANYVRNNYTYPASSIIKRN